MEQSHRFGCAALCVFRRKWRTFGVWVVLGPMEMVVLFMEATPLNFLGQSMMQNTSCPHRTKIKSAGEFPLFC